MSVCRKGMPWQWVSAEQLRSGRRVTAACSHPVLASSRGVRLPWRVEVSEQKEDGGERKGENPIKWLRKWELKSGQKKKYVTEEKKR
jgi:hypothetical protein